MVEQFAGGLERLVDRLVEQLVGWRELLVGRGAEQFVDQLVEQWSRAKQFVGRLAEQRPMELWSGQLQIIVLSRVIMVHLAHLLMKHYHGGHVAIRLALGGCANRPFFRIVAAYNKRARDSKYLEQVGCYDPLPNSHNEKLVGLNIERIKHWIGCGAHVTKPVEKLL
ncbi:unnamed protein product, partial [Lepidochelys olivacea]